MKKFFVIILLFCAAHVWAHPIHVSIASFEYNDSLKSFNVSYKFFSDDFEEIINQLYQLKLNLGKKNQMEEFDEYIEKYINSHVLLRIGNKENRQFNMTSFELGAESIWIYGTYQANLSEAGLTSIENTLMFDLFLDQKNLLILKMDNLEEGFQFNHRRKIWEIAK